MMILVYFEWVCCFVIDDFKVMVEWMKFLDVVIEFDFFVFV